MISVRVLQGASSASTSVHIREPTVRCLLHQLGKSTQECLVARNGEIIPIDERLAEGDEIVLIRAISGG